MTIRLVPGSEKQLAPRQELPHSRTAGAERVNLRTTKPKIIRKCLLVAASYETGTTFFIARVGFSVFISQNVHGIKKGFDGRINFHCYVAVCTRVHQERERQYLTKLIRKTSIPCTHFIWNNGNVQRAIN